MDDRPNLLETLGPREYVAGLDPLPWMSLKAGQIVLPFFAVVATYDHRQSDGTYRRYNASEWVHMRALTDVRPKHSAALVGRLAQGIAGAWARRFDP